MPEQLRLQLVRHRKRWHAQTAWVLLTDLAHNLLTWTQEWMWADSSFERYGYLRLIQDVLSMPGFMESKGSNLEKVTLQQIPPLQQKCSPV